MPDSAYSSTPSRDNVRAVCTPMVANPLPSRPASVPAAGYALDRIGNTAVRPLERGDALHLVVAQREVEDAGIVGDALRVGRARDRSDVLLKQPAQCNLR